MNIELLERPAVDVAAFDNIVAGFEMTPELNRATEEFRIGSIALTFVRSEAAGTASSLPDMALLDPAGAPEDRVMLRSTVANASADWAKHQEAVRATEATTTEPAQYFAMMGAQSKTEKNDKDD